MIYLYSKDDGFLEREGLFCVDRPVLRIKYKNGVLTLNSTGIETDKPFLLVERLIRRKKLHAAGFITYDYGERIFGIKDKRKKILSLPDIYLVLFRRLKKVEQFQLKKDSSVFSITFPVRKEEFINAVKRAKDYIERGDIYQINLSHPIVIKGYFNKKSVFQRLINYQPTPFMMLIEDRDFSLISGSMELFLKRRGNRITTKPIKGTRPRGKTEEEDIKLKSELENSVKERAENLMITDLMRNDLGRICKGVEVDKLFEVEEYSSLFQMSSTVRGILREDVNLQEIVEATFLPGSVTGAPKKRAMEIIAELERFKRSVYCGATVFIKPNLDFTMSVAIRQIIFQSGKAVVYVGSGIVADSKPEEEYRETMIKAKASFKALGVES